MDKLSTNEKIIAAAGALLLIDSFLPWFKFDIGVINGSRNGWSNAFSLLAVLIGVAMAAQVILTKLASVELPEKLGNLSWGQVHMIGGIAALVLVVVQLLAGDDPFDRSFGLFLGVLCAAGLAYGGVMYAKDEPAPRV